MLIINFGPSPFEKTAPGINSFKNKGLRKIEIDFQSIEFPNNFKDRLDIQNGKLIKLEDSRSAIRIPIIKSSDSSKEENLFVVWCEEMTCWLAFIQSSFIESWPYPNDYSYSEPYLVSYEYSFLIENTFHLEENKLFTADLPFCSPKEIEKIKLSTYKKIKRVLLTRNINKGGETMSISVPVEIQESLYNFKKDNPDTANTGFLMMQFGKSKTHSNIVNEIKKYSNSNELIILRADDRQYHEDLFYNILTYIYGSSFGVAIFERIESDSFNSNVSFEIGYMMALKKPVCLLKEYTLKTLPSDLAGKQYRIFNSEKLKSIDNELSQWLKDMGIGKLI